MRRLWLALALIWLPSVASAQIAVVQHRSSAAIVGSTISVGLVGFMVGGNAAIAFISWEPGISSATLSSVTDDLGSCSGYTHLASADVATNTEVYYCASVTNNAFNITATFSAVPTHAVIIAYEISGQATSTPIDVVAVSTPGSSSAPQGPSVTTDVAHTLAFGYIGCQGTAAVVTGIDGGSAFTGNEETNNLARCVSVVTKSVTTCTASGQPQWDLSLADTTMAITLAWKESGTSACGGSTFPPGVVNTPIRCCTPPPAIRRWP